VYVDAKKIAALGLRVRKGCSYHGLSFNLKMDTRPFTHIPPCGYKNLEVTQLADLTTDLDQKTLVTNLLNHLQIQLGYNHVLSETVA
jgi:lipoyl(octanoyl) transferase